jgi:hypothetical protein
MLRDWTSHADYRKRLKTDLLLFFLTDRERVCRYEKSILKLYLLDLDKAFPITKTLYPENKGRPAKNQAELLRSFIFMIDRKCFSLTQWANKIASDRLLCAMCGFDFNDAPGAASYYDLIDRLWKQLPAVHIAKTARLHPFKSKPARKLKAGKKLPPKHTGAVAKLAALAMQDKLREERYESILQQILAKVIVETSAELGLLGDVNDLSLAGDGTSFDSGASCYGVKACNCKNKGIYKCKCPRRYPDPDATWGWDSYRERYFYGNTLYCLTASDSPNDLPVYLRISEAKRHDSVLTIFALNEVRKMYPGFKLTNFIADGSMDNYPTYELCNHWKIRAFIPLDSKTTFALKNMPSGVIAFDDKGRPICEGGIPYANWGWCPKKHSIKYRCYFDANGLDKPCSCTDSYYGRTVYIKTADDLRLFPPVPRSSQTYKNKLKNRTSVERTHKRLFEDYQIRLGNMRSKKHRFSRATFAAINVHLDAWIKHIDLTLDTLLAA